MNKIAVLRRAGWEVEPIFTDEHGALVPEEQRPALLEEIERSVQELARGRASHAQRTLADLEASGKSDAEQVEDLLSRVYRAHANGERAREVLDAFLDRFERWLNRDGIVRVDLFFDRLDLDRAPDSLGVLLLSTTRLTRDHFTRRQAFLDRFQRFLIGRGGRRERDVENILRGLRA